VKAIFVEGRFPLTNQLLSDLRAAGVYVGKRRKLRPGFDAFSVGTRTIRMLTKVAARDLDMSDVRLDERLHVAVVVVGHERHDPDAWVLLGKAAIDGLRDAKVIASDRFQIGAVLGMVLQTKGQHSRLDAAMGCACPAGAGFVVALSTSAKQLGWLMSEVCDVT